MTAKSELIAIPRDSLHVLVKWAYHASEYDGQVAIGDLRAAVATCPDILENLIEADERRRADEWCSVDFEDL